MKIHARTLGNREWLTATVPEAIDLKVNDRLDGGPVFPTGGIAIARIREVIAEIVEGQYVIDFRFDEIDVYNVNQHQEPFIKSYGGKVIPMLKRTG